MGIIFWYDSRVIQNKKVLKSVGESSAFLFNFFYLSQKNPDCYPPKGDKRPRLSDQWSSHTKDFKASESAEKSM
jgi:hypothetical protein